MEESKKSIKVLLVDDESIIAEGVRRLIADQPGIEFNYVSEISKAIETIHENRPDVLLLDGEMGDGEIGILESIRSNESLSNLPVLELLLKEDANRRSIAFKHGCDDYLIKMPSGDELVTRIRNLASRKEYEVEVKELRSRVSKAEETASIATDKLTQVKIELEEASGRLALIENSSVDGEGGGSAQQRRLAAVLQAGQDLSGVRDIDLLMSKLLNQARTAIVCDAGSFYLREGENLTFTYTENDTFSKRDVDDRPDFKRFSVPISPNTISGYAAHSAKTVVVDDCYSIPEDVPYSYDTGFDKSTGYRCNSMMAIPLRSSMGEVLGVMQLINPLDEKGGARAGFNNEDEMLMRNFAGVATVALENAKLTRSIIMRMIKMAELRDPSETGVHCNRVADVSVLLYEAWAKKHGKTEKELEQGIDQLRIAAMLHDVGKVTIPDSILKKPGKLTDKEYATMQTHTMVGTKLFSELTSEYDIAALDVVRNHHERWDGKGYPGEEALQFDEKGFPVMPEEVIRKGKNGVEIPLYARIVCVADVFDALSSRRSYKDPWMEDKVVEILQQDAGTHFDPELIELFMENLDDIRAAHTKYDE